MSEVFSPDFGFPREVCRAIAQEARWMSDFFQEKSGFKPPSVDQIKVRLSRVSHARSKIPISPKVAAASLTKAAKAVRKKIKRQIVVEKRRGRFTSIKQNAKNFIEKIYTRKSVDEEKESLLMSAKAQPKEVEKSREIMKEKEAFPDGEKEQAIPIDTKNKTLLSLHAMKNNDSVNGAFYNECIKALSPRTREWMSTKDVHVAGGSGASQVEMTNAYRHSVVDEKGREVYGATRLGVISDHTNEFTNIAELSDEDLCKEKAKKLKAVLFVATLNKSQRKQVEEQLPGDLQKIWEALPESDIPYSYEGVKEVLTHKTNPFSPQQKEKLEKVISELNNPAKTLQKRECTLKMQTLGYLTAMVEYNQAQVQEGSLCIVHNGLLNPAKGDLSSIEGQHWRSAFESSTGWMHCESNESADMQAMMKEFRGKKIELVGQYQGAFVDKEIVYLPAPCSDMVGRSCDLQLIYMNTSVQGHDKKALQKQSEINKDAFNQLDGIAQKKRVRIEILEGLIKGGGEVLAGPPIDENELIEELERLKKGLELYEKCTEEYKGKSSFNLASKMNTALYFMGASLSGGCFGDKDRTGVVSSQTCARVIQNGFLIKEKVFRACAERADSSKKKAELLKQAKEAKKKSRRLRFYFWRCFLPGSIALQIAQLNANQRCLKVTIHPSFRYLKSIPRLVENSLLCIEELYDQRQKAENESSVGPEEGVS